jgi:ethanolamine utilization microcompartment shell protein EutS
MRLLKALEEDAAFLLEKESPEITSIEYEVAEREFGQAITNIETCDQLIDCLEDSYDAIDGMGANPCIESLNLIKVTARNALINAGLSAKSAAVLIPSIESFAIENVATAVSGALATAIKAVVKMLIELAKKLGNFVLKIFGRKKAIDTEVKQVLAECMLAKKENKTTVTIPVPHENVSHGMMAILNTPFSEWESNLLEMNKALSSIYSCLNDNAAGILNAAKAIRTSDSYKSVPLTIYFQEVLGDHNAIKHGKLPTPDAIMGIIPNYPFGYEFVYNIPNNRGPKFADIQHYSAKIRLNAEYQAKMEKEFADKKVNDLIFDAGELLKITKAVEALNDAMRFDKYSPEVTTKTLAKMADTLEASSDSEGNTKLRLISAGATYLLSEHYQWVTYYGTIIDNMMKILDKATWSV